MPTEKVEEIKCNCTICGSRFRVRVDREGNVNRDTRYCVFCRSMLEDTEDLEYQKVS
jgi:hypothetical protein